MRNADRILRRRRGAERRGRRSELWAALLLIAKGYRILGWRVRTQAGEIDIVAQSFRGIVCFVEVKMRSAQDRAIESIGPRQQERIARAAELYLARRPSIAVKGRRFDTVVLAPRRWPKHIPDAWRPNAP